jgi:phosphatidylserine/phosphatidylglycerophosphate/cardiolipin synthase-like enzyme/membrane protein DedA with SNARE-associated domain
LADSILKKGRNCWRIEPCRRAAFLIDGEAYYSAFAAAVERARKQVIILGWDIDSRVRLVRDDRRRQLPGDLGGFLKEAVSRRRSLHIHILDWDFAMLYALEREMLPIFKFGWGAHRRLHFELDGRHPVGASHHQKIVVVDDKVAFTGGMDLASGRWDTPEHDLGNPRRRDNGKPYPPHHDVQMMVDGPAAAALGELARQRWQRATGKKLRPPRPGPSDPWPPDIVPDMGEVSIGIARTEPAHDGRPGICEIKNFHRDAIAAARSFIYIENQYLTSAAAGDALAARLGEENGPEVIAVVPRECSGWLEEGSMGVIRARLLRRLQTADLYGRFRVCHPVFKGTEIYIHSKVLLVDDTLLRIGSSNLNNRSMGLDSECDLIIEAGGNEEHRQGIVRLRNRLLGEHLGLSPGQVAEMTAEKGSVRGVVDALQASERHLEPLVIEEEDLLEELIPGASLLDPERPVNVEELIKDMVPREEPESAGEGRKTKIYLLPGAIVLALALAAAWRLTPLGEWLDFQTLTEWGRTIGDSAFAPLLVIAAFTIGGLVMFPVTVLILVTALTFGPVSAFFYSLLGSVCSGALTFGLGRILGRETVRKLSKGRLNRLSRLLSRRGMLAVTAVRIIPIAPFTVVNLAAGATHIRFTDFLLGTLAGMTPGVLAITIFEKGLESAIREPQAKNFIILLFILLSIWVVIWLLRRWISAKEEEI